MKKFLTTLFTIPLITLPLIASPSVSAAGWSNVATVQDIEIIRGQGFQIRGEFGNPSSCSVANTVFVAIDHPQYDSILAMAKAAFMANKKLYLYSHTCIEYGWHGGSHNQLTAAGSIYLKH